MRKETEPAKRLLAIGDIHGCLDQLENLLTTVAPTQEDRLIFLGDYIDRGPNSRGVVDSLLALSENFPDTIFLKGNHEAMFLDFLSGRNPLLFLINGGQNTLASYQSGGKVRIPGEHIEFFENLRPLYETERFIFVHAGLRPHIPIPAQKEEDLLWIREEFLQSSFDWGKTVVFGHTPLLEPIMEERKIGIDTGAVYGGRLACCDVVSRRCCYSTARKEEER